MKEVFEKIIEKLEKGSNYEPIEYDCDDVSCVDEQRFIATDDAIEIVKQIAEEHDNGWIPCSERLPKTNESVLCWAKSTARGDDVCFVGSCHNSFWFLQSSADTHSFPGQYVVVAWHTLPEPYQPKGE